MFYNNCCEVVLVFEYLDFHKKTQRNNLKCQILKDDYLESSWQNQQFPMSKNETMMSKIRKIISIIRLKEKWKLNHFLSDLQFERKPGRGVGSLTLSRRSKFAIRNSDSSDQVRKQKIIKILFWWNINSKIPVCKYYPINIKLRLASIARKCYQSISFF